MEMLLQSHDGVIDILPALPDNWSRGSFRGLCARGGITVDCTWEEDRVVSISVVAERDCAVTLRLPDGTLHELECKGDKYAKVNI